MELKVAAVEIFSLVLVSEKFDHLIQCIDTVELHI